MSLAIGYAHQGVVTDHPRVIQSIELRGFHFYCIYLFLCYYCFITDHTGGMLMAQKPRGEIKVTCGDRCATLKSDVGISVASLRLRLEHDLGIPDEAMAEVGGLIVPENTIVLPGNSVSFIIKTEGSEKQ